MILSGDTMSTPIFPRSREAWLALGVLPPKTYVLTAYPLFLVCLQFAPRNRAATSWALALLLGYLGSFIWLTLGALCQLLWGGRPRAQNTAVVAVLALVFIWLLRPALYGGF
jgi:hypothetical protein